MASEGPRYPGTTASLANAGSSESANAWTNTGNIVSDDGTESTITAATFDAPDISELLVASNFGFGVSGTVDGITVEIDRRGFTSANSGVDNRVQLATGTTFADLVGSNKASASVWPQTTSGTASYGGTADTWSAGLTAAQVNAAGFAVFLSVKANVANADIGVDFIRVTVTYTPPAAIAGTATYVVAAPTLSGTGAQTFAGTATIAAIAPVFAATGEETFSGTGAPTIAVPTFAATGSLEFTGTGSFAAGVPTLAATGTVPEPDVGITGTGAIAAPVPTLEATGEETFTGSGDFAVAAPTFSGAGAFGHVGTGDFAAGAPTFAGTGGIEFIGSGGVTIGAPTLYGYDQEPPPPEPPPIPPLGGHMYATQEDFEKANSGPYYRRPPVRIRIDLEDEESKDDAWVLLGELLGMPVEFLQ